MSNFFISVLLAAVYLPGIVNGQNKGFTLIGKFKGLPDRTSIYLVTQEKDTVVTAISDRDHFILRGYLPKDGRFHFILVDTLITKKVSNPIFLINDTVFVSGEVGQSKLDITGSQPQKDEDEMGKLTSPIRSKNNEIANKFASLNTKLKDSLNIVEKVEFEEERDRLISQQKLIKEEFKEISIKWLKDHNNSLYAPYVIIAYKSILKPDEMQTLYDGLTNKVKEGYYGDKLKTNIEMIRSSLEITKGSTIPNFTISTPDGKRIFIRDIAAKNKYTLIDCWASWCAPCRAEIPHLKEIYANYKEKGLGILGVSSDKNTNNWKKAISEDKTPWVHGIESDKREVSDLFDLKAIPAYILIDQQGRFIAFDCLMSSVKPFGGSLRGERLEKTLAELLGKK